MNEFSRVLLILLAPTLMGIAGASAGIFVSSKAAFFRHLIPFGAGLLMGMALFLILPEALAGTNTILVLGMAAVGFALFSLIENGLHRLSSEPHAGGSEVLTVALAFALHSLLDGWTLGVAAQVPQGSALFAVLLGMGTHKVTTGFAVGAVFRATANTPRTALSAAALCEALTVAGGLLAFWFRHITSEAWTTALTALTVGSFIYLAWHSYVSVRRRMTTQAVAVPALTGFIIVALLATLR